jgi:DNA invertase Pin-like site-specific DNA recombinase
MEKQLQVVGYVRVSSQIQAKEGISLEAQKDKIAQYCQLNDAKLLKIYSDNGVSGAKAANRKGFQDAIKLAIDKKAAFVCWDLSRFSRSTQEALKYSDLLAKVGADLVLLKEKIDTTTANGRLIFSIMSALNQFERELGGERTRTALQYRRSQGKKIGGHVPFGYDVEVDGILIPNKPEQRVIRTILRLYEEEHTYSFIADYLNKQGKTTKNGGKWYIQSVKNVILYNKKYGNE